MLERYFKLKEHGTTASTEIMAGCTTFLTAAYILAVNPAILSKAGMPAPALFTATAVGAIIGTLLVGLYANMPFLLAPGMGINMFFAYAVVVGKGYSWREALTATLISGFLFLVASVGGIRERLVRCFPVSLRNAMTAGLGLMIAAIGMTNCGLLIIKEGHVSLGDLSAQGAPLLAAVGILITGALFALRAPAAILLGIIVTAAIGIPMGVTDCKPILESGIVSTPPSVGPIAMAFDFASSRLFTMDFAVVVVTLFLIDMFDSLGSLVGVLNRIDGKERDKYDARIPRALMCDAVATMAGACVGTSTVTAYVESSTGIDAGGRTGLTAVTVAAFIALALFLSPLFLAIPYAATAPALLIVGMHMMGLSIKINWADVTDGLPAVLTILVTAMTLSISDGLMFGWLSYVFLKILSGRARELNAAVCVVALVFLARLALL